MDTCSTSVESADGRAFFSMTPNAQLKMPRLGNYCLTILATSARAIVQDCAEAEDNTDARDKFFMHVAFDSSVDAVGGALHHLC